MKYFIIKDKSSKWFGKVFLVDRYIPGTDLLSRVDYVIGACMKKEERMVSAFPVNEIKFFESREDAELTIKKFELFL